jgi:hypothetical protein
MIEPEIIDTIYHHLKTIKTNPLIKINKYKHFVSKLDYNLLGNTTYYIDISFDYQRDLDPRHKYPGKYTIAHIGNTITTIDYHTLEDNNIDWTDPQLIDKLEQTITQWNQDTDIIESRQRITKINAIKATKHYLKQDISEQ